MRDELISSIRGLLGRGEFLSAADIGSEAVDLQAVDLESGSHDPELVWATALALARCGATERAVVLVSQTNLLGLAKTVGADLASDIGSLWARLAKDEALWTGDKNERAALAVESAARYELMVEEYRSDYAAVNAATLRLLAGDDVGAGAMAKTALDLASAKPESRDQVQNYWRLVTEAEAQLVLGSTEQASVVLHRAAETNPDWSMLATTLRQLRLVCQIKGIDAEVLSSLRPPTVIHYSGHMFKTGPEERLVAEIDRVLIRRSVGAAYGSLACGSDLLIAERALAFGAELHITLPCDPDKFLERSVLPGGTLWVERWKSVLAAATSWEAESTAPFADEAMFEFCDRVAMGNALIRARQLESEVFQLALWDGQSTDGIAGTAAAVQRWQAIGERTTVIDLARSEIEAVEESEQTPDLAQDRQRAVRGILFVDVKGFSGLSEVQLPGFFEHVMKAVAEQLEPYGSDLLYRNTWGDGVYLVFAKPVQAARCALEIQDRLETMSQEKGWEGLTARIGGHAGPVFEGFDYICDEPAFYGTHVTRAARIEPRTPPGEVYVTADFAALTASSRSGDFRMEYVGHVPTAKDYGTFRMYLLRR